MRIKLDSSNALGIKVVTDMNPLEVAEAHEFHVARGNGQTCMSYRERALRRCLESGVDFQSTNNNIIPMAKLMISITCPYCQGDMGEATGGGGTSHMYTIDFMCRNDACKARVHISFPPDGIRVRPDKPAE